MNATTIVVYVFVVLLFVASITLLATKQYTASVISSLLTATVIVVALLPCEPEYTDGRWVYNAGGGAHYMSAARAARAAARTAARDAKQKRAGMRASLGTATSPPPPPAAAPTPPAAELAAEVRPASDPNLPTCTTVAPKTDAEIRQHIRDHGLYGVRGNLTCARMQRGAVADKNVLQPLEARDQLLQFVASDQLHAKDSYLIAKPPSRRIGRPS